MKTLLVVFALLTLLVSSMGMAKELDDYEQTCKELGFKPKTTTYGECVLELRRRDLNNEPTQSSTRSPKIKAQGDGSSEDVTCQKYGFEPQTVSYNQCRLQIDLAKRQLEAQQSQYEEQKQIYEQQLAEVEKEKQRQRGRKQLEMGLRMLSGQSATDAAMATARMFPILPRQPAFENYMVTLPGGHTTNCTYSTATRSMNCQ